MGSSDILRLTFRSPSIVIYTIALSSNTLDQGLEHQEGLGDL
jgi:hypothetical protein